MNEMGECRGVDIIPVATSDRFRIASRHQNIPMDKPAGRSLIYSREDYGSLEKIIRKS